MGNTGAEEPLISEFSRDISDFQLDGRKLNVKAETSSLSAYRLKMNGLVKTFVVVFDDEVHVIELEQDEKIFTEVVSHNESCKVETITKEDIEFYSEDIKEMLSAAGLL